MQADPAAFEANSSKCNCLKKVSNFITGSLEGAFYRLGKVVGRSPWITILISVILSGACMVGMLNFTQESRAEKLWSPQDSKASKHQAWVQDKFPTSSQMSVALLVAKDVLTPKVFIQALEMDQMVKGIQNGTKKSWENVCLKWGKVCFASNLLQLWSFNETIIRRLTKEDILKKINQPNLSSPVTHRRFVVDQFLGNIKTNSSNFITNAEAMTMTYGLKYDPVFDPSTGRQVDEKVNEWELKFAEVMKSWPSSLMEVYYFTRASYQEAAGGSIQGDVRLLSTGYLLIIIYVALVLGNLTRLNIKVWLAVAGVLSVGLAIGVSFGLASAFGMFYGPVHSTLPFLLLGIGVDDMFVIVQAWGNIPSEIHHTKDISERIGLTLKHAGCSITVTSLTDFLAFMIGASTILPALRSFCIFAGIGILMDFFLQATFFTAWVAIDARRQEKKRDGCCCCIKLPDDYTESNCGRKDRLKTFFDKIFAPALLSLPGKIIAVVITASLFSVNLYGTLMIRQYFDRVWFLPPDTMAYKHAIQNDKFFPVVGAPAVIYTGEIDYFKDQSNLHKLYQVAAEDKYIVESSIHSWYEDYTKWARQTKNSKFINSGKSEITNETVFYTWLQEYLQSVGMSFKNDVKFANKSGPLQITATRMSFKHKDMDSTQTEVKAMDDLRKKISKIYPDDEAFAYSRFYLGWETNKVISEEVFRNVALALVSVFIATLIVLANLWTSLMVFTCVGFTLVNLAGTMHFWGLTIDTVTTIVLVLAVGLAVDYSSHIGHTFMICTGSGTERAHMTLRDMGPAVWNGGFSTFLAFVLLAFSSSYVFKTFFKVFFCVVVYGTFHGLVYLPVLMSSIGPSPYDSATTAVNKPQRSQSPVHPSQSAGDNVSYELAVARGRAPSDKNENVYIPPPDYNDVNMDEMKRKASTNAGFQGSQGNLAQTS